MESAGARSAARPASCRAGRSRSAEPGKIAQQVVPLRPGELLVEPEHLGGQLLGHQQQAGGVLGALEVAPHPVERVGDAGEDHGSRGASTQVSLLPPPWEELTT